jgi:hypothetical protein
MATPADEIAAGCLIKKSIHGLMKRAIKQEHSPKTQDLDPLDPLQRRVNALLVAKTRELIDSQATSTKADRSQWLDRVHLNRCTGRQAGVSIGAGAAIPLAKRRHIFRLSDERPRSAVRRTERLQEAATHPSISPRKDLWSYEQSDVCGATSRVHPAELCCARRISPSSEPNLILRRRAITEPPASDRIACNQPA